MNRRYVGTIISVCIGVLGTLCRRPNLFRVCLVKLWLLEKQLCVVTFGKVALEKLLWDGWKPVWLSCFDF
jgi:hypothetical protein